MSLCECGCGQQTTKIKMTNRKMGRIAGQYNRFVRGHNRSSEYMEREGLGGSDLSLYEIDPVTGCWNWTGLVNRQTGYGIVSYRGKQVSVHRLAYEIANHVKLTSRFQLVRHTCDNRICLNPNHLILGTHKDNSQDAVDRGRTARGTSHGLAKLNPDKVREIRQMRASGESYRKIAGKMGVTWRTIQDVVTGTTWSHVED